MKLLKEWMKYMKKVDRSIVSKWSPVVEMYGVLRNSFLTSHICNFCEWISKSEKGENLPLFLEDIYTKMESVDRVEIIAKVFNPITCIEEYKLSNGRYVPIADKNFRYELTIDELSNIFGIEYVKYLSIEDYRDIQLTKII